MTNMGSHPNHVHLAGDVVFGTGFGGIYSVTPVCLSGDGHAPHIEVRFKHGLRLDITPLTAADLSRELGRALAKLPLLPPIHDAISDGDA